MPDIVLLCHDIRSCHNVGSLLRTAEGLGLEHVYFTGYTPYPTTPEDDRLPHISAKLSKQIHKTALGAEESVSWSHEKDIENLIESLRSDGFLIVGLEQAPDSIILPEYKAPHKVAVLLGREVEGIDGSLLSLVDDVVEIPMSGTKESFNVVQAAAMMLYHLRFSA